MVELVPELLTVVVVLPLPELLTGLVVVVELVPELLTVVVVLPLPELLTGLVVVVELVPELLTIGCKGDSQKDIAEGIGLGAGELSAVKALTGGGVGTTGG